MRTVLYTLLGCECRVSVVKFCFLPTRKGEGGYHQSKKWRGMRTNWGDILGKQLRNAWATGPQLSWKSCKKAVKCWISRLFMVDSKGFEPSTSRMRTERSPNWATSPSTRHLVFSELTLRHLIHTTLNSAFYFTASQYFCQLLNPFPTIFRHRLISLWQLIKRQSHNFFS